jgi:HK97 family phage portal protein
MSLMQKAARWYLERKGFELQPKIDAGYAGGSSSSPMVTPSSAIGLSAVYACTALLSGTISSLPLQVFRTDANGYRRVYREHPLYALLHDAPNYDQTSLDFLDGFSTAIELRGSGLAAKKFGTGGRLIALRPIHPDAWTVKRLETGALEYRWTEDGRKSFVGTDRDVLHVRGPGGEPLGGMATLAVGRKSLRAAMSADEAAFQMFENGMRPSGQIAFKEFLTPQQRSIAETLLVEKYVGAMNAGKPFIAEGGAEYKTISITPEDAQMLETRGFNVEEICRFFGVPPVMIGHPGGSTAWPTSVEQQVLVFQKFTLRRRLKRIEKAMMQQLLTPEERAQGIIIEFNLEGLLAGDSASRAAFYAQGLRNGWMTINEVRGKENLPAVAGGDTPRMQMQNIPITQDPQKPGAGA